MNNMVYIFLGILFFILLVIGAIFGIWSRIKILVLLQKKTENGSTNSFDFIAYKKRAITMEIVSLILLTGFFVCIGKLISSPPDPTKIFWFGITIVIEMVMITVGAVYQLNQIKELRK